MDHTIDTGENSNGDVVYPHPASPELFATVAALWANACDAEPHCPAPPPPSFYPMILHLAVVDLTVAYDESTAPEDVPDEVISQAAGMLRMRRLRYRGALLLDKVLSRRNVLFSSLPNLVIASGATPILAAFLDAAFDDEPALQQCAASVLATIASHTPDQQRYVAQLPDVLTNIVRLIRRPSSMIAEDWIRVLGNIALSSAQLRDVMLDSDAGVVIAHIMSQPALLSLSSLQTVVTALWFFCRGNPPPRAEHVRPFVPIFASLVSHSDQTVATDALQGLSELTERGEMTDALVAIDGALPSVFAAMQRGSSALLTPALRIAGNFCLGNAEQTGAITELGLMHMMPALLSDPYKDVRKEAARTLSHVLATGDQYITTMLNQNVFPHVLQAARASEADVRKEALWCIANAARAATPADVQRMLNAGVVPIVFGELQQPQLPSVKRVSLEALENLLEKAPAATSAAVEARGGVDVLQELLPDANQTQANARALLERFFEARVAA